MKFIGKLLLYILIALLVVIAGLYFLQSGFWATLLIHIYARKSHAETMSAHKPRLNY